MVERFLSAADAERAFRALKKLARSDLTGWALTGGLAIEIHRILRGRGPLSREFNDIDFVVGSFDSIPKTLRGDFLFRHVHPSDPPGRTLMQMVEPENAVRIDVFRAFGQTMRRTMDLELPSGPVRLISLEDLAARSARLALDIDGGDPLPTKHARDYLRLVELVEAADVEEAWRDQRKTSHPASFQEANRALHRLLRARSHLLVNPEYSTDTKARCPRCVDTVAFPLARPREMLAILGYC